MDKNVNLADIAIIDFTGVVQILTIYMALGFKNIYCVYYSSMLHAAEYLKQVGSFMFDFWFSEDMRPSAYLFLKRALNLFSSGPLTVPGQLRSV